MSYRSTRGNHRRPHHRLLGPPSQRLKLTIISSLCQHLGHPTMLPNPPTSHQFCHHQATFRLRIRNPLTNQSSPANKLVSMPNSGTLYAAADDPERAKQGSDPTPIHAAPKTYPLSRSPLSTARLIAQHALWYHDLGFLIHPSNHNNRAGSVGPLPHLFTPFFLITIIAYNTAGPHGRSAPYQRTRNRHRLLGTLAPAIAFRGPQQPDP